MIEMGIDPQENRFSYQTAPERLLRSRFRAASI
jgi:hypothetical protein